MIYSKFSDGEIYNGDCLEVMKNMPSNSFRAVVTSPPYNLKNSSGNGMKSHAKGRWQNAALIDGYTDHDDNMPHEEYVAWQRNCLSEMMRLITDDGVIFYNHKWRVQKGLLQDRADIVTGFPVRQIIIWQRSGGINFNETFFVPTYEVIYMIAKPKFKLVPKTNGMGDVWSIKQERNNPHPAPFPVEIPERCLKAVGSGPILDPFLGSGSTSLAARNLGMQWTGIELSKKYCEMAAVRLSEQTADCPIIFS